MSSRATADAAARAFSTMWALDSEHAADRRELRAAGVAPRTVQRLYPRDLAALTPHLIKHIEAISAEELLVKDPVTTEEIDALAADLPKELGVAAAREMELPDSEKAYQELYDYLSSRLTSAEKEDPLFYLRLRHNIEVANTIARGIWWANWAQMHRGELPADRTDAADLLMLAVARTIAL